jgi:hypothetical protein
VQPDDSIDCLHARFFSSEIALDHNTNFRSRIVTDNHPLIPREINHNAFQQTHLRTSHRTAEPEYQRRNCLDVCWIVANIGQRRRAPYNTRSQKVRVIKTPGGELRYLHIKKKGTAPKCGVSAAQLHAAPGSDRF